jgi:glycosylphosphatidylinositol phospholipase D
VFKSQQGARVTYQDQPQVLTQPDMRFENPNMRPYDHFGHSFLIVQDTILIGAPGYSTNEQRVGRIYAFDRYTRQLRWTMSGSREFQQYGR